MAAALAVPTTSYRRRSATNDLKEIVEEHMEELFQLYDEQFSDQFGPIHRRVRVLFERFIRCGDLHFGFARVRCKNPDCPSPEEKIVPLSCRSRGLCPSCGQRRAIEWAERMVEEVLPRVPYRQLIFTIPRILRRPFLFDRSLYGDFSRTAYRATRDYLRERAGSLRGRKDAVPAMVSVPQSFGDLLITHPHLHSIVSLGLFGRDGIFHPLEEVDFSGLEALFSRRFFKLMLRREKVRPDPGAPPTRHGPPAPCAP
jgi:hypothetical protein